MKFIITTSLASVLLMSCIYYDYGETPYTSIYIQEIRPGMHEIAFAFKAKVSGNLHSPSLPFSSSEYEYVRWFYIKTNVGVVESNNIILTDHRGCKDPLFWQKDMKGRISLSDKNIVISLQMPRYDTPDGKNTNTIQRYVNWKHNGEYMLINNVPQSLMNHSHVYRPSTCDNFDGNRKIRGQSPLK